MHWRRRNQAIVSAAIFASTINSFSQGQQAESDRGRQASATLPESNEALLLTGKIDDAIRAGEHRLAIELIAQIMKLPAELVASPGSRTYQPVWRHASRIIAQLPEPALQMYRQLYDAEAAALLSAAVRDGRIDELWRLFRAYPQTTSWPEIGRELVARLLDQGNFASAVEILSELLAISGDDAELRMQLIVATVGAGAHQLGSRTLESLRTADVVKKQNRWEGRLNALKQWMDAERAELGFPGAPLEPYLAAGDSWSTDLANAQAVDRRELIEAIDTLRRLPLLEPVVADDTLVFRNDGTIYGFDLLTLARKWKQSELRSDLTGVHIGVVEEVEGVAEDATLTQNVRTLLTNYLQHCAVAGFGHAYTIEGQSTREGFEGIPRRPFQILPQVVGRSELVARSLRTGALAWRTGVDGGHALADASFQDAPLLLDDRLIAPYSRNNELRLAVLDPQSGRLIQDVSVVGPPLVYSSEGGRCLLTKDAANVFVSTGNGVIAALSQRDLSWQWACTYSSSLTQQLAQNWWQPQPRPIESGVDRPIVADNLLIVAPLDTTEIFGIDRFSGRERWRFPRREYIGLAGMTDLGLVVIGNGLACFDISDPEGRPVLWRTVGLEVVGRPAINGQRIFVPTRNGVVAIDAKTGKLLADEAYARGRGNGPVADKKGGLPEPPASDGQCGNLLVAGGGLYSASPNRIVRYPDLDQTRAIVDERMKGEIGDVRAALALAWVDQLTGNGAAALERLQALSIDDPALGSARDRLLGQVFVDLAGRAGSGDDRLALLRRAAAMAQSPESAARLAAIIGDTLEKEGRWADAIAHYGEILAQPESRLIASPAEPGLLLSDWLPGIRRLKSLIERAPQETTRPELERLVARLETQPGGTEALLRLIDALPHGEVRTAIQRALMRLKLAPELLVDHLASPAAGASDAEKRRAHLVRWETHVGLLMLSDAADDQAAWKEQFAGQVSEDAISKVSGDLADDLERDRKWALRIERKQREFSAISSQPFVADVTITSRRWRVQAADLLIDSYEPMTAVRNWIPIRARGEGQIQVIETGTAGSNWLQTPDFVGGKRAPDELMRAIVSSVQQSPGETRIPSWSMKSRGHMAAIPSPGGIICIGLAPGPTVRKRAWEFSIPQWNTALPREIHGWVAAGPKALYVCPRADRIASLSWSDGKIRWQREFPGVQIARIACVGDRLIIFSQDRQVFSLDASWGDALLRPPPGAPSASQLEILGDAVLAVSADGFTALDAATLAPRWAKPIRGIEALFPAIGANWVAYQLEESDQWRILDVADGNPLFESAIADGGAITALAFDGQQLLVATTPDTDEDSDRSLRETALTACDPKTGKRHWRHGVPTSVRINATQLLAHPVLIPILIDRPSRPERMDGSEAERAASAIPAIELIARADGRRVERFKIETDDRRGMQRAMPREPMLLVTPTRIMVQIDGDIVAYGNPPAGTTP